MDRRDQVLRSKIVRLVKVLWQHRGIEKVTCKHEDTICVPIIPSCSRKKVCFSH